ncbi:hypothetical protein OHB53_04565 [Streptomyces sp. NBC_00056]|uniref:hypothetical protein n=1 Tax=unclassified Streptomyces TaxID=2593676 RepID=UPI0022588153|nr:MULTISPECIES: hypothetical protein [unclassified Streptomyces]MCX5442112.1 hypothetical protein [Streptomyces sp. NBC_00063]WUB91644.1 hypothetical protein OHO83_04540 [Streptomyces sp. NBC_00569]
MDNTSAQVAAEYDGRLAEVESAVEACREVEQAARRLDAGLPHLLEARRRVCRSP